MLFGAYFAHFGDHTEYANEPNLHIMWETSSRDTYHNLRPIQEQLWTADSKICSSEHNSAIMAGILNMQMSQI